MLVGVPCGAETRLGVWYLMFSKSPMQSVNQQVPDHVCKTPVEDTGHLSFLVCHPFFINERMLTIVPRYLHLDLAKHVMRNVSRLRLRAHTLKVEAAAWRLEDGSCVCDQCPGEDEHVQNEVHALLICQDHRVRELRKHFSFLFTPFFEDFPPAVQPFLLQQVNNQLVHNILSQQNN